MQARRASRELALIIFSQFDKNISNYKNEYFSSTILKSVRTLISSAQDEISHCASQINEIKDKIIDFENNHEQNLQRPIDAQNVSVPIEMTEDFEQKLDCLLLSCDKVLNALDIAELTTLASQDDVKDYVIKICDNYKDHKKEIDSDISEFSFGWDIERIFKIDKDILRIAITEIAFIKDAPHRVVIDEALELAKKYSTDDSPSFINGILARIVDKYV